MNWIDSSDEGRSIYILYGVAGVGKSTVAKSIAERAAVRRDLGASFFFSRNEESRKTAKYFLPTLAYQLAQYNRSFASRINEVLEEDPAAAEHDFRQQFYSLIAKPLRLSMLAGGPIVVVVDALDECEGNDAERILALLAQEIPQMQRLRVFVTARPERHIRNMLNRYRTHEQFCLHDIEDSVVEADIRLYLDFRLSSDQVQRALPELLPPWQPTETQKRILIGMSGKLFIVASTAVNFILDGQQLAPAEQLNTLISGISPRDYSGSHHTFLDHMYMRILCAACPKPIGAWVDRFQTVVGTIILLRDPLPCKALAQLLDIDANDVVRTLSNLHSLLAPRGEDQVFRVHHKSFPDFICDPNRRGYSGDFHIDLRANHLRIAKRCLFIMNDNLHLNHCGFGPSEWYKNQAELSYPIEDCIKPHVAYACTYWASHLVVGGDGGPGFEDELRHLLECFALEHLLHWLEALSIVGRMDTAYSSLEMACKIRVCHLSPTLSCISIRKY
jgi:hypothetical protein